MTDVNPILIVDDERNIRLVLGHALREAGYSVDAALSGEEALAMAAAKSYRLILLDLKLPGMDGLTVLHRLTERRPETKVLVITAHGSIESAVEALRTGAVDYLQKPFSPSELRERVRRALEDRSTESYDGCCDRAREALGKKEFQSARAFLRRALGLLPGRPEAFNLMGRLLEEEGNPLEAQEQYRVALSLDEAYRPARKNLDRLVMDLRSLPDDGRP
ncbi:response regulator [Aminithiophilus ramosus]|uniref:Response regulator n=1 Tax=Aminithiophilus ramosus TaxID=3029084 RepID=A0A9Q7AIN9_9BACT|nr:response regulator [Aminithiophilus ramosus]QTX32465.1 response regulator [Aminithiophilus ramosus]